MDRLEEVRRFQKVGNAIKGFVVDKDSPQQCLFRLDVVRSGTVERGRFFDLLAGCRISEGHWLSVRTRKLWHSTRFMTEMLLACGYPAIHKLYGAVGKAGFFLTADGATRRYSPASRS